MGHQDMSGGGLSMALGMLAHMPWYHYLLMAVVVLAMAIYVHVRIRRTYWPQHATMRGIARNTVEHLAILAGVEVVAIVFVIAVVGGSMVAYHIA